MKPKFVLKSADSVRAGDRIKIYGFYELVKKVRHVNAHPVQMYEIYVGNLPCIRVPAGWQIKVETLPVPTEAVP